MAEFPWHELDDIVSKLEEPLPESNESDEGDEGDESESIKPTNIFSADYIGPFNARQALAGFAYILEMDLGRKVEIGYDDQSCWFTDNGKPSPHFRGETLAHSAMLMILGYLYVTATDISYSTSRILRLNAGL